MHSIDATLHISFLNLQVCAQFAVRFGRSRFYSLFWVPLLVAHSVLTVMLLHCSLLDAKGHAVDACCVCVQVRKPLAQLCKGCCSASKYLTYMSSSVLSMVSKSAATPVFLDLATHPQIIHVTSFWVSSLSNVVKFMPASSLCYS